MTEQVFATEETVANLSATPDFDCYPVRQAIKAAAPIRDGVRVVWDDGLDPEGARLDVAN